jgi:hypothetical protein
LTTEIYGQLDGVPVPCGRDIGTGESFGDFAAGTAPFLFTQNGTSTRISRITHQLPRETDNDGALS